MDYAGIGSLLVAFVALVISIFNTSKRDTKEVSTQMATIVAKLDNILNDIHDLKVGREEMRRDIMDNHDEIVKINESLKSAWNRIDEMRGVRRAD